MNRNRSNLLATLLLLAILGGALLLRLYDLHWDRGYLFHPDERQILIVVDGLSFPWPPDWRLLLSAKSPWNPGFFAYGSFPIYLLRICASAAGLLDAEYASLNLSYVVGRVLSALFDVGTVGLVYVLGRKLFCTVREGAAIALISAFLVALAALHIQLAHFYTVDTVLTFWVVLTVLLAVDLSRQPTWGRGLLAGVAWGAGPGHQGQCVPLVTAGRRGLVSGRRAPDWGAAAHPRRRMASRAPRPPLSLPGSSGEPYSPASWLWLLFCSCNHMPCSTP